MEPVCVAGVSWATNSSNRAAVIIEDGGTREGPSGVPARRARVAAVVSPLDDAEVVRLCTDGSQAVVAVDVPFGWPKQFARFAQGWSPIIRRDRQPPDLDGFCRRTTELVVKNEVGKQPLSISSEKIALSARSWMELVHASDLYGRVDVGIGLTGQGTHPTIIEAYPAAAAAAFSSAWNLEDLAKAYRKHADARRGFVAAVLDGLGIEAGAGGDGMLDGIVGEDREPNKADAFLAAATAFIYLGRIAGWDVRRPGDSEKEDTPKEGWIFFPIRAGDAGPPPGA